MKNVSEFEKLAWMAGSGPNYNPQYQSRASQRIARTPNWGDANSASAGKPLAGPATPKKWGVVNNMWGDLALSSIPVVGGVYMANNAIQDFRHGDIGSGIANSLWAALSVVPGAGAVGGGLKALRAAGKVGKTGKALSRTSKAMAATRGAWRGSKAALPGGTKTMLGAGAVGLGAPALLDPAKPAPAQPAPQPAAPQSWIQAGSNQLQQQGY